MKYVLSIGFVVGFLLSVTAQLPAIDSLKRELPQLRDTALVDAYMRVGELSYTQLNDIEALVKYMNLAIDLSEKKNYEKRWVDALTYLGIGYAKQHEFDRSFEVWNKALEKAEALSDTSRMAYLHNKFGYNYDQLDDLKKALEHFILSANFYEQIKDYNGLGSSYMNIASVFGQQEQKKEVLFYTRKSMELVPRIDDPFIQTSILYGAAAQYAELGATDGSYLDSSLTAAGLGLKIAQENQLLSRYPKFYNVYSTVYEVKGDYTQSIRYSNEVLRYKDYTTPEVLIVVYIRLTDCYSGLGKNQVALNYLDSSNAIVQQIGSTFYSMIVLERAYNLNKELGNYHRALESLEQLKQVEDSLLNSEKNEAINNLETQYQTEKKEHEILRLQQQTELQHLKISKRNYLILGGIILMILILVLGYLFYRQKIMREKELVANTRQRLLRSQINPHFFFNALASIQTFFLQEKDGKKAVLYLSKFSKLMRLILENSSHDFITLEEEMETITNYLDVQQVRFKQAFDYTVGYDPEIVPSEVMIPPMIAQPFIENSLEHGLLNKAGGRISIYFALRNELIELTVKDNGVGLRENTDTSLHKNSHKSRATQIIKDRLYLLSKTLKKEVKFSMDNLNDVHGNITGAQVKIELPIKHNK